MPDVFRFDWKNGAIKLPAVLVKICTHGAGPELEYRFRGDMGYDRDTYNGIRMEVFCCIQCGNTKPARVLFEQYQNFILTGEAFTVGRS